VRTGKRTKKQLFSPMQAFSLHFVPQKERKTLKNFENNVEISQSVKK